MFVLKMCLHFKLSVSVFLLWPRANAECERFKKTIGKAIRAAHTEHRSWKQVIYTFLRNYRATPHATTEMSPAEILFVRKINTKLPDLTIKSPTHNTIRKKDKDRKLKMKKRIAFTIVFINRSHSALARDHNGVIFLCLNPILSANFRNSCELNGGTLSLFSSFGIPKITI
jgi:hypothetical protein